MQNNEKLLVSNPDLTGQSVRTNYKQQGLELIWVYF